ncbi:hypothetical protein AAEX28_06285 [Lentisphaerota bacterium WC36G]|nr:hypothetical protein LJT99_09150 [Lentisphaerae bacterium WC36]
MDIDLSNLSKQGRKNFVKFYEHNTQIRIDKNLPLSLKILIPLMMIIAWGPFLYFAIKNDASGVDYSIIWLVFWGIVLLINWKIRKKSKTYKNLEEIFWQKYAQDGVFDYCFECNCHVDTIDENCSKCNAPLKFHITKNPIYNLDSAKNERNFWEDSIKYLVILYLISKAIFFISYECEKFASKAAVTQAKYDFMTENIRFYAPVKYDETLDENAKVLINKKYRYPKFYRGVKSIPILSSLETINSYNTVNEYCESYNKTMVELVEEQYKKREN